MAETDNEKEKPRREMPWPGGARSIAQPGVPTDSEANSLAYFADSDLAETDPNWTGLWPQESDEQRAEWAPEETLSTPIQAPSRADIAPLWPPASDDPQIPPRAWPPDQFGAKAKFVPEIYIAEPEEDIRRSGLAWSAGIVFFSSVAFMLFLGWGADLLFGSKPFGLVAGIVLGSAIGFIQFFKLSSQMYGSASRSSDIRPFLSRDDDDDSDTRF
jgi:F0F1-type ATP synthase assembly protein I